MSSSHARAPRPLAALALAVLLGAACSGDDDGSAVPRGSDNGKPQQVDEQELEDEPLVPAVREFVTNVREETGIPDVQPGAPRQPEPPPATTTTTSPFPAGRAANPPPPPGTEVPPPPDPAQTAPAPAPAPDPAQTAPAPPPS